LVEECETAKKLRAGQEIEALEQQPQNAARDPMGRDYYGPLFFQYRNQHGSNRDRDHAKGEAGPPLAPKPVSVVQRRLNKPCYDEIRRTYGGNQAANNQQQKIGPLVSASRVLNKPAARKELFGGVGLIGFAAFARKVRLRPPFHWR